MDSKLRDATLEEFNPEMESVTEEDCVTTRIYLPGFRKDQLRVQLTKTGNLIISGERQEEDQKWSFRKEFSISRDCDTNKISAKFEGGTLFVRQPKVFVRADPEKNNATINKPAATTSEIPKPLQKPMEEPKPNPSNQKSNPEKNNPTINKPAATSEIPKPPQKPMEEPKPNPINQKSDDSKMVSEKSPEMKKPEIPNGVGNDSKKSPETKKNDIANDAPKKKIEKGKDDYDNNASKGGEKIPGDMSNSGKNRVEKHRQAVGELATKLNMPRRVMNMGIAILIALVVGLYVKNSFGSWKEAKN